MKKVQSLVVFTIIISPIAALADTFILKDGSKLEGEIITQTADAYTLDVRVTKNIKEERKVLKSEVTQIITPPPVQKDLIAFEALQKFIPAPDSLSAKDYEMRIKQVARFLIDYGNSPMLKDAQIILRTLQGELDQVKAGGMKFKGEVLSPDAYKANIYEINSEIVAARIRTMLQKGQTTSALREFVRFDSEYIGTNARKSLLPLVVQAMRTQLTQAKTMMNTHEQRMKQRSDELVLMSPADRQSTQAAIAEEEASYKAQYDKEAQMQIGWLTLHPFIEETFSNTISYAESEISRTNEPVDFQGDSGKAYRDAWAAIQSGNFQAIRNAMSLVSEAMIPERYVRILEAAATSKTAAQ